MPSRSPRAPSRSWDAIAEWYAGWSGPHGSDHHRLLAIPALMLLLDPQRGERILDIGCGPGPLAPAIARRGASYLGVDLSPRLLAIARRHHGSRGQFALGDATRLAEAGIRGFGAFDAATFLLSLQDIDPLEAAIASAASALRPGGRLVVLMTHPCFRIPRQSGWGFDGKRKLTFRRIDRYLGRLAVPMQTYGRGRGGTTRSYHRPLQDYVAALALAGFAIDALREIPGVASRAEAAAEREIPLFFALRARKQE